jgi:outer membrane lipoprotein carrier protein
MREFVLSRLGIVLCLGSLAVSSAAAESAPAQRAIAADRPVTDGGRLSSKPDLKTMIRRLQEHYRGTNSFSAKFKERIASAGGVRRERQGTIAYRKPGALRWEFGPPQNETIVSDGKTLYDYEPDLNQVVETPLARAFRSSAPTALLLGIGDIERDFVASPADAPSADRFVHVALTARADGTRFALALDPKTYDVAAMTITDQLGNVTALDFSDIRTNLSLDGAMFAFKVPEGADVVAAPDQR